MKRYQVNIFATKADLESLLRIIEAKQELQFVRTGLFDVVQNREVTLFGSNLGIAVSGDNNQEATYLVANRSECIQCRTVPQRSGDIKYAIDQQTNSRTIVFRPSGVFGEGCLIAGYIGTISTDPVAIALFQSFSREIKHQFKKIKSFYVGKEAEALLAKGWRLTSNIKSPLSYDLTRG
jgi:hypothetical protein